ncbi:MAG: 3-oxoacid CoA-transferase subunit A [Haliea sp.]
MNKLKDIRDAIAAIPDGASIMVGGFGSPGTPFSLLAELMRQGQRNLTLVKNDANEASLGISKLIESGQVKTLITTHIGLNKRVVELMNRGSITVQFHPQGILAEKIRVAGSGSFGFLSDIGIGTEITDPSTLIEWQGKKLKIEAALSADFALISADRADHYGNLCYRATAMNFSPLMAMAAEHVIAETPRLLPAGSIVPEQVHTPSAFVAAVVHVSQESPEYQPVEGRYGY